MIQHILFDFDGTLVDSQQLALSILNQLAEKYQFQKVEVKDIEYLRTLSLAERCRRLKLPLYKLPLLALEARKLYQYAIHELQPFPGIRELLEALKKQGFHLAVLSSNSAGNIRAFLLKNQIDTVGTVYSSAAVFGKDAMIRKYLSAHQLSRSQILYVGDEQRDIVACRKSGIRVVWVSWGYDAMEIVKQTIPDFIAHTPEDILSVVQPAHL